MKKDYEEFTALPAWTKAVWANGDGDGELVNEADPFKWSGKSDPPAIGAAVTVSMNGLGAGTVVKYFAEHGWFGLLVQFAKPPAWYTKQNGGNVPGHIFGVDLKEVG